MYSYRCSQPADTWDLKIQCEDGLEIRKNIIYGDISGVFIDKSEDNKTIKVYSRDWLPPKFGSAILIAKNCSDDKKECEEKEIGSN